jgi:hypothetical protein
VLIHWKGETVASVTWEDVDSFLDKYLVFQLEDELLVEGEGGEMSCGAAPIQGNSAPRMSAGPQTARQLKSP